MAKVWHGEGSNMYNLRLVKLVKLVKVKLVNSGGLKRLEVGEVGMTTDLQSNK